MGNLIGDMSFTWHLADWSVVCHKCSYRASSAGFNDLPSPFFRVVTRGSELWAWNRDHFYMLLRLLNHESISGDPYEWFATYAHGDWLRENCRRAFVKQMRRFLKEYDE